MAALHVAPDDTYQLGKGSSSSNLDETFHISTQFRRGSVTSAAYPPQTLFSAAEGENIVSPSSLYTHVTAETALRILSPIAGEPIDPRQGLRALSVPSIRATLPWTTHTQSSKDGKRQSVQGYNEFAVSEPPDALSKLLDQLKEPLILLLLGSALVSLLLGETDDAISIVLAVGIVVAVAHVQERKSEESLQALNKLVPHYCHLVRDGTTSHVLANELVPGDIVTFSTGDRIPADVRLTEAIQLETDESPLTGEIKPRQKAVEAIQPEIAGPAEGVRAGAPAQTTAEWEREASSWLASQNAEAPSIGERENIVFMGTLVKSGYGRGVVVGTGPRTEFGAVFAMVDEVKEKRTPLQLSMDDLAKKLSMASLAIIGMICVIGLMQRRNALEMFTIGVSLAVAAIPEGLPIVVTVTLALGVLRMSRRKAIVKKLPSVETLGSVSVICSDKTGTLTTNKMTVCRCFTLEDAFIDLTHREDVPPSPGRALSRTLLAGNLCNNSHRDEAGQNIGQATDVAMVNVLRAFQLEDKRPYFKRSDESAFSSDTKFMSVTGSFAGDVAAPTAANLGNGQTTYLKGALDATLARCSTCLTPSAGLGQLDAHAKKAIREAADEMASEGFRVIACATGPLGSEQSSRMTFCGLQALQDPPRNGVKEAVAELRRSGIHVMMITGDSEVTATAIAKQVGILDDDGERRKDTKAVAARNGNGNGTSSAPSRHPGVMTGHQIDALSERQLQEAIGRVIIFARTTPRHKMNIVKALQANGETVAMTGDGVNDAPALKMADIGIALGKGGTDVAKEAADVILVDDNFATIMPAVEEGKGIFYNIQNFLAFQLSTAVAALSLITLSTAFGLKLPLNPMQILFINILMDGPPSQSLGVDPIDASVVMRRKPRRKDASVLTKRILLRVAFSAAIIVLGTLYIYVSELTGDGFADERDQTMTFTCFVFLDLTSAVQNRGLTTPLLGNRMLVTTVSISLFVQFLLVYLPLLQGIFQTTSLALSDLGLLVFVAALGAAAHEGRRAWERRWRDPHEDEEADARWAGSAA
ncbi:unnamed protein product [Parajaminaea phylloscopi]